MAEIHKTTLVPSKVELLRDWLPRQSWYVEGSGEPRLTKVGGFRLDDPAGEVGIEFMFVRDDARPDPVTYQVPMTYRAERLSAAEAALIGRSEHGVLGERWIYDGAQDPVLVAQLLALVQGAAEPQHQSVSDTPEPSVTVEGSLSGHLTPVDVRLVRILEAADATPPGQGEPETHHLRLGRVDGRRRLRTPRAGHRGGVG